MLAGLGSGAGRASVAAHCTGAGQRRRRRRGNVVHSSVSVLRSGALFQTYTAHNTSHRHHHQPLLYTLFSELCVRSHHRTGAAAETVNKPVNSDPCVRQWVVAQTTWPGASPLWLCCTWHQQWPALKPWWRLKELWHIAVELQLEETEPKQWRGEDSSSYEEKWREQWM